MFPNANSDNYEVFHVKWQSHDSSAHTHNNSAQLCTKSVAAPPLRYLFPIKVRANVCYCLRNTIVIKFSLFFSTFDLLWSENKIRFWLNARCRFFILSLCFVVSQFPSLCHTNGRIRYRIVAIVIWWRCHYLLHATQLLIPYNGSAERTIRDIRPL